MKIFLTGGSGYIGNTVALRLKKAGHDVLALVRSEEKGKALKDAGIKLVVGDMATPAGYAAAAWGRQAIVHTAVDYGKDGPELDRKTIQAARELLSGQVGATSIYNAIDASQHTQREVAEAASRAAGKEGKVQAQAPDGSPYHEALMLDQRISSEKARNDLDWRPRHESFTAEAEQLFKSWKAAK